MEQAVLRHLEELTGSIEVEISQAAPPDVSHLEQTLTAMKAQQVKLESRRSRLYTLLEDGTYTRALFSQRMEILAQEESTLLDSIASVEGQIRRELSRNKEEQLTRLRTVLERYQASDLPARKELLHSIVEEIRYTKEKKTKPADFALSIKLKDFV